MTVSAIDTAQLPVASERLTVLIAAFNEETSIPLLHPRLCAVLAQLPALQTHVLYVDDGSTDGTWEVLHALTEADAQVSAVRLSRNFGKEVAISAGLDHVLPGAVVLLDADGQDPPELIPEFVALWRGGYDNIFGTRVIREGESWLKRSAAHAFYRVIRRLSRTPIPADTGDFRLLSPRVVQALQQLRERHRFMKGLFGWVGFRQVALPYRREPRLSGHSKFTVWRLWNFALDGITSFSTVPLRAATYLGLLTALLAFLFGAWVVIKAALVGDPVAGWPTLMSVILFLGGVQLIALGLIGEYLGRLYDEAKQRPLYLVDTHRGAVGVGCDHQSKRGAGHADRTTAVGDQAG
nr:glycosyltransferase family 2 protein [Xanthomonas euvesicatoria]